MNLEINNLRLEPFAEVFDEGSKLVVYAGWLSASLDTDGLFTGDLLTSARFKVIDSTLGVHALKKREFAELFSICEAYIRNSAPEVITQLGKEQRHSLAKAVVFEVTKAVIHEQLKTSKEFGES